MSSVPQELSYAPWGEWRAKDYLSEYYAEIMPDEQHALAFLCESLQRLPEVSIALDYGCGPTIHHAMALVPKAKEIYLAEYLQDNLNEVRRWLDKSPDSHDWSAFTRHILGLEGNSAPSESDVIEREEESRRRFNRLIISDAGDDDPLGPEMRGFFPLVTTHYCAEGATNCKDTWRNYMRNIASLVRPGGALIVSSCATADFYVVGEKTFPCAGVSACDLLGSLQEDGFIEVDMRVRAVPDHSEQGYGSVIFACAIKGAQKA